MEVVRGVIVGLICERCQTTDEYMQAEIHSATLDYKVIDGLLAGRPKAGGA